ncbi:hypothetical protein L3X38_030049 [Prunus dulcis]|uniref:Uncharacterized protein n=1 Tax=Prunus dulcis TaxID=3755 RepID=A0AAD4Z2T7_PRUDU|nr:hypothetical protein L3X38_030049 [Prunus dulcis]
MRKSGLTRGSPNLVILCLRKVVSLRKIKFLQKERSVRPWGYRCGTGRRLSDAQKLVESTTRVPGQKYHDV